MNTAIPNRRVLIIDDDLAHLSSTRGILEGEGYEVLVHTQGFGSTNVIAQFNPDLVLLDVNMPGLSGDHLPEVYRANPKTRDVRVVLYSSNDEDSLRAAARRLKLAGYICKGSPAELRSKVAALLRGGNAR